MVEESDTGETSKDRILNKTLELLADNTQGLRYSELLNQLSSAYPSIPPNKIQGIIVRCVRTDPRVSASNGIYQLQSTSQTPPVQGSTTQPVVQTTNALQDAADYINSNECIIYAQFADWLMGASSICIAATPLVTTNTQPSNQNPDVIGVWLPKMDDIFTRPMEFISVEIKKDVQWKKLVSGLGQAAAYTLFSHKVYFVIPGTSSEFPPSNEINIYIKPSNLAKLNTICQNLGIGLITFTARLQGDEFNPDYLLFDFKINTNPRLNEPNYEALNRFIRIMTEDDFRALKDQIDENLYNRSSFNQIRHVIEYDEE